MTKDSKAEATTAMPADTAATPAPVEVGNDATSRPSRRSRKAGRRPRVGRIHRLHRGDGGRRSVTGPTAPVNDAATTNTAPTVAPNEVSADANSRHSLTERFQVWNEKSIEYNEKSIECAIEKGRVLKQGQEELGKKEWIAWVVEDLHIKPWSAGRYIQISDHPILSDKKYWKQLPADYRTLYELSLIRDHNKLLEHITKGDVHHDLSRDEATKLKRATMDKKKPKDDDDPFPLPDHLQVLLNALRFFLPDKDLEDYMRHNRPPSDPPVEDQIEDATRYVLDRIRRKRGIR
jgi:hypothetical protein